MRQLTIAQRRERQLERFNEDHIHDINKARYITNSLYRLAGLDERLVYLQNDERTCDRPSTRYEEERALNWVKRLNKNLKPYDLQIMYSGIYPQICKSEDGHRIDEVVFYVISY